MSAAEPNRNSPAKNKSNGKRPFKLQENGNGDADEGRHRSVPHSPDAEKGVLSSMLQAPNECIGEAMEKLKSDQFYNEGRRILFETAIELFDGGKPVDLISLNTILIDRDQLDMVGGPGEIADILSFAPSAAHFDYYAEILRDKYTLREIINAANESIQRSYGEVARVDDLLDNFERDVLAIREKMGKKDDIIPMRDQVMEAIHLIEELFTNRDKLTGISTGYKDYDAMSNGLHGGEMTIIAARPSMGKTSLAMNIVENVAIGGGHPVAVFSLEMSSQQLVQRMLCSVAGIEMQKLRGGFLSEKRDFPRLTQAAAKLAESNIFIDDTPSLSVMAMRAKARRLKKKHDIQMIMIDYLQLMRSETKRAQENRQQEVAEISSGVKALAKELNVPIIVLAQLNRSPETRAGSNRPKLSDLRESGSIEQDADVVGLLMREEYYAENDEERGEMAGKSVLIIAKQRNGSTGDVNLTFRKELMRFEDRAPEPGEGEM